VPDYYVYICILSSYQISYAVHVWFEVNTKLASIYNALHLFILSHCFLLFLWVGYLDRKQRFKGSQSTWIWDRAWTLSCCIQSRCSGRLSAFDIENIHDLLSGVMMYQIIAIAFGLRIFLYFFLVWLASWLFSYWFNAFISQMLKIYWMRQVMNFWYCYLWWYIHLIHSLDLMGLELHHCFSLCYLFWCLCDMKRRELHYYFSMCSLFWCFCDMN